MTGSILTNSVWIGKLDFFPGLGVYGIFSIWMLIDAIRRKEFLWVFLILAGNGYSVTFFTFIAARLRPRRGLSCPARRSGNASRNFRRKSIISTRRTIISNWATFISSKGKLEKAEAAYRASLERDPQDIDARAHLGQCLLRQKKAAEARPLLEGVCAENPKHDYGYSMMALAEALTAVGEQNAALEIWQQVTASHSYPRAKVQLAELYIAKNQPELARAELRDVLADDIHAPKFQRKRDRVWVRRAKGVARKLGGL